MDRLMDWLAEDIMVPRGILVCFYMALFAAVLNVVSLALRIIL